MRDIYGGTMSFFDKQLPQLGVEVKMVGAVDAAALVDAADGRTRVLYLETPTNPFNRVVDVKAVVDGLAARFGARRPVVVLDATFASPFNFRPAAVGVDLVVHSATKYLNGHSDVIAGIVSGSRDRLKALVPWLRNLGGSMDPHQAFLLARGMRTLHLRMAAHNANAQRVAQALAADPRVERVWYPGLPDHPDAALAARQMTGFGGIVSFQLSSRDAGDARVFLESLALFQPAASLGGVESLATVPALTSHQHQSPAQWKAAGITPTLVRLAVGIEDADDLVSDLVQALDRLPAGRSKARRAVTRRAAS
jgi:cystathionine beta-lyase/cystathionine gamma-synthase